MNISPQNKFSKHSTDNTTASPSDTIIFLHQHTSYFKSTISLYSILTKNLQVLLKPLSTWTPTSSHKQPANKVNGSSPTSSQQESKSTPSYVMLKMSSKHYNNPSLTYLSSTLERRSSAKVQLHGESQNADAMWLFLKTS